MASPEDKKTDNTCKVCGDKLSKEYTRANHPEKVIVRHLTNKDCKATRGNFGRSN